MKKRKIVKSNVQRIRSRQKRRQALFIKSIPKNILEIIKTSLSVTKSITRALKQFPKENVN